MKGWNAAIPAPKKDIRSEQAPTLWGETASYVPRGGLKMWGMSQLLYLRAALKPWGEGGRETQKGSLKGKGGRQRESLTEPPGIPSVEFNWAQSHQTGLPRFQSLPTFVNHQPVSLHQWALPAVTPSTQTGWQQLLCLKEGLWISQH